MRWLKGKRLFWTRYIRIYTDGGYHKFRYFPRFRRLHYSIHWGMWGFCIYLFGREFNFSFGIDKNKLYEKKE